jgi:hypothetical protein
MKRSTRLLLVLAVIETGLAGLWLWLLAGIRPGTMTTTGDPAQAASALSSTFGGVMGLAGGAVLIAALLMRRRGL